MTEYEIAAFDALYDPVQQGIRDDVELEWGGVVLTHDGYIGQLLSHENLWELYEFLTGRFIGRDRMCAPERFPLTVLRQPNGHAERGVPDWWQWHEYRTRVVAEYLHVKRGGALALSDGAL